MNLDRNALRTRLDSPAACLLVVLAIYSGFIFLRLVRTSFDWSSFVIAGDRFSVPDEVPPGLTVLKNSDGFDGQIYYRLALDPFTTQEKAFGITIDNPPYRHQRILYPFLAWVISMGDARSLPVVLVMINLVCIALMGMVGGLHARSFGVHSLWGLLLPLYPGFLLTVSRDLVEILEMTLVATALLLIRKNYLLSAVVVLTGAVLTKETSILVPSVVIAACVLGWIRGKRPDWRYALFIFPLTVYAVWQFVLFRIWGQVPMLAGGNNLGIPLVAPAKLLVESVARIVELRISTFVELAYVGVFIWATLVAFRSATASMLEKLGCIAFLILVMSLGSAVWVEGPAFMRAFAGFGAFGAIVLMSADEPLRRMGLKVNLSLFAYEFFKIVAHR